MADGAAADLGESFPHFVAALPWNQYGSVLSDHLLGRVPEQPFGALVPTERNSIQRSAGNGIVRRLDDRCQQSLGFFGLLAFRDVPEDSRDGYHFTGGVFDRRPRNGYVNLSSVPAQAQTFVLGDDHALQYLFGETLQA